MKEWLKRMKECLLPDTKPLTAFMAWNQTRFSMRTEDLNVIAKKYITEIMDYIEYKTKISPTESCIIRQIPIRESDVYDIVLQHFKNLGYICLIKSYQELGDIDNRYVIISWANGGERK